MQLCAFLCCTAYEALRLEARGSSPLPPHHPLDVPKIGPGESDAFVSRTAPARRDARTSAATLTPRRSGMNAV
jgi:hypothetical protein